MDGSLAALTFENDLVQKDRECNLGDIDQKNVEKCQICRASANAHLEAAMASEAISGNMRLDTSVIKVDDFKF